MKTYSLVKNGMNWNFKSEIELENFVWFNLEKLFNLVPIKKQYHIEGLYCDIIAKTHSDQLVVIELKIVQDRYIVQQLTRYFDYLKNHRTLVNLIDFDLPVKLIGILPSIHSDNLIDIKYHCLVFELYQYHIKLDQDKFYFECTHALNQTKLPCLEIFPQSDDNISTNLPPIPAKLTEILRKSNEKEYKGILATRSTILNFEKRMKETVEGNSVIYGFNKSTPIAEFRYHNERKQAVLFLWLPLINQNRSIIARMKVWTDWINIYDVAYVRQGTGKMISSDEYKSPHFPIQLIPAKLLPFRKYQGRSRTFTADFFYAQDRENYQKFLHDSQYRQEVIERNLSIYTARSMTKQGCPLAMPINKYFEITRNAYELEQKRQEIQSRAHKIKISSNIKQYTQDEYSLNKVVEFALEERFLMWRGFR